MKKFVLSIISLVMMISVIIPMGSQVSATSSYTEENNLDVNVTTTIENEEYSITTTQDGIFINNLIKSKDGYVLFITNTETNKTEIESDFLNKEEISEYELNLIENENYAPYTNNTNEESSKMNSKAITGSWTWGGWQNSQITVNGKATVQIVIGLLGSRLGVFGNVAAAIATIWIQYNLKTGYFKTRNGSANDTDRKYIWRKKEIKTYSNSSYSTLLSTKTTDAQRILVWGA